jgi:signal transduction histidine kinase
MICVVYLLAFFIYYETFQLNRSRLYFICAVRISNRTPLAALIGWTELLMSDQTLSSSAQSTVSMLHSSTLSLLTILNALLDVSKVSAAKMTNCSQNFNLHDLVLDTARMMTGLSGTRTVELLVDFSAQVPELVRADPGIIKQVLGNLISNAIKVTHRY